MADKDAFGSLLKSLDWNLLCLQKQRLVTKVTDEPNSMLWGLVYFLNALQDIAQDQGMLDMEDPALLQLFEVFKEKPIDSINSLNIEEIIVTVKQGSSTHEYTVSVDEAIVEFTEFISLIKEGNDEENMTFRDFIEPTRIVTEASLLGVWHDWQKELNLEEPYDVSLAWKSDGYVMREFHNKK